MTGVLLVCMFAVGVGIAWYYSPSQRIRRALRKATLVAIADFPDHGEGKICGRLSLMSASLTAPLTGRRCSYYEVIVEEHYSGRRGQRWRTRIHETSGVPFEIRDDSGRGIVDPRGAQVALVMDAHTTSGTFDDPTPAEAAFLARHGEAGTGWMFNRTLRYREGALEEGETVAVFGRGMKEPDPDGVGSAGGLYREAPPTRLRLGGSANFPLLISDHEDALGS